MKEINEIRNKFFDDRSGPYQEIYDKLVEINSDQNLLAMSCDYTNLNLVNFLLEQPKTLATLNEPEVEFEGYSRYDYPIHVACAANSLDIVKRLIEAGADLEARDLSGGTALQSAAFSEKGPEVFLHLCSIDGININAINRVNISVLSQAVTCPNDVVVVKKLLEMGVDISNVDAYGKTAFHHSCLYGSLETFKLLLDHRCDINLKDSKGNSPLHCISDKHFYNSYDDAPFEKLKILLKAPGLDKSVTNNSGETALHVACLNGTIEAVNLLLNTDGIDKFALDSNGENILHKSARRGDWKLYEKFAKEYKFDHEIKTKDGRGIIHLICEYDHREFFDDYIMEFFKKDNGNKVTAKPQRISRKKKNSKSKKTIDDSISNFNEMINSVDEKGWTPLHYACDNGSFEIIERLVEFAADFNKKDLQGKTPIDIAESRGHLDDITDIAEQIDLKNSMDELGLNVVPDYLQGYDLSNHDGYYWSGKDGHDDDYYNDFISSQKGS